ncbi:hypothetical protein A2716_05220 [candidate division WWE3 bacterium RIFCSPHIGHO2_01_FULL_40_23]|uniref:SAM-dependent MTase RsmB/NOP-type domain-containing protein n=1 Tax=candidate division WWE3 bacterium RIFCSPLOWO2_01_FULL_41_18 TaxID=1802625 RepID=A0A1F4VEA4_UNCKA|nr:MAG: hypothetical protein A2716_05220 [candidate division WWE3 bacterium RIFCSPHIGHO2_01_FULL_40_23]OGC55270.1 MAG: hypothetical protein A3A78_04830 [candidate division WWE3 bacterium RIFCSPLOWO2_01_FULL_41_18]
MQKIEAFQSKIKEIYPQTFTEILENLKIKRPVTFRVNTLKSSKEGVISRLKGQGFQITKGPLENSFIIKSEASLKLSQTEEFNTGGIYIQELSSMIPVLELSPKEGENILDLCAAPGSKTTQIVEITQNKAFITAVERSKGRFFALKSILNLHNAKNINTMLANGVGLEKRNPSFINFFDKVLIDAPCTNEARLNPEDEKTLKFWNPKKHKSLSSLQKGLLISGIKMLKNDGILVYSTCTFQVEENELVVNWLLEKFPGVSVEKLNTNLKNSTSGITEWKNKKLNQQIKNTKRILPNRHFGGFFIAKLKKKEII